MNEWMKPGMDLQVFPAPTWERGQFFVIFYFQTLDYRISENIQVNPWGFIRDNNKGP